jgi:glycosyltransferase involved in cell wall biosynthesis
VSRYLTLHAPLAAIPGARATFYDLTVENRSANDWNTSDQQPVHVSYHWLSEHGEPVIYDGARTALPQSLRAGERCRLFARVHPPPTPGRYLLEIDLVHEGVRWLDVGQRVSVECLPVTQPRAILVNRNCFSRDAIGNNIVRKLQLLREWGYAPLLLVNDFDRRLPLEDQALMLEIDRARLLDPPLDLQWAARQLWQAGLYIFDYPEYYPLLELIRDVPRGAVFFDYHGVTPPELWTSAISRANIELGVRNLRMVGYADYAIAHSEYTRTQLIDTGAIAPDRVALMPYTVSTEAFFPSEHKPALTELAPGDGPLLLYVGRMASNKRIDTLVRMAALVQPHYPRLRLLLVGDDAAPVYQEVVAAAHRLVDELGLTEHVRFTGQVCDEQLLAYYQAADVFVTASLHEGFCIPVVEAMACAVPVVAAAATALPSTVGDGGLLFEPENVEMFAARVLELLGSCSY